MIGGGMSHRGMFRRKVGGCPSYIPGLYTVSELDQMIFVDGYIPVASANELSSIRSAGSKTMGVGTCWENTYSISLSSKYVQVLKVNFSDLTGSWGSDISGFSGVYDGNELVIDCDNSFANLFASYNLSATYVNMRGINIYSAGGFGHKGGLIGDINGGLIKNCIAYGEVGNTDANASYGHAGIVAGQRTDLVADLIIEDCHNYVKMTGNANNFSGIIGVVIGTATYSATIKDCTNYGVFDITGSSSGAICGSGDYVSIENCQNFASLEGNRVMGGIIGVMNNSSIEKCTNSGAITSAGITGGIVGTISTNGTVKQCFNTGDIDCLSISTGFQTFVGGVVGNNGTGTINISECKVSNCTLSGGDRIGGLVGVTGKAAVQNCQVDADVTVTTTGRLAGGVIGSSIGSGLVTQYDNVYSAAEVYGATTNNGGFAGLINNITITWNQCYWDKDTSGLSTTAGGAIGKTTTELQTPTSNTGIYSAWSLAVWDFGSSTDYPSLINTP